MPQSAFYLLPVTALPDLLNDRCVDQPEYYESNQLPWSEVQPYPESSIDIYPDKEYGKIVYRNIANDLQLHLGLVTQINRSRVFDCK